LLTTRSAAGASAGSVDIKSSIDARRRTAATK
jgi:hypothetical protein